MDEMAGLIMLVRKLHMCLLTGDADDTFDDLYERYKESVDNTTLTAEEVCFADAVGKRIAHLENEELPPDREA